MIRDYRFEDRTAEGEQCIADIDYEMARSEESCVDNYRWYKSGDKEGEEAYNAARNKGCCGSFDGSTSINGEKWFIGCNYGH